MKGNDDNNNLVDKLKNTLKINENNSQQTIDGNLNQQAIDQNNNQRTIDHNNNQKTKNDDNVIQYKHINFAICKQRSDKYLYANNMFKIMFDIGTPRPHLIILFNQKPFSHKIQVKDLTELEIQNLLQLCEDFVDSINGHNEEITISFHTGNWASTRHFHCHICLNENLYLQLFKEKHPYIKETYLVPSKHWDMTLSDKNDLYDLYIKNVLNYKLTNTNTNLKYKELELASIKSADKSPKKYQLPFKNKSCIDLIYDMNQPKLKFNLKGPSKEWTEKKQKFELTMSMIDYAHKGGYFDKKNGCHVCLKIKKATEAYLLLGADKFYGLHPLPELFIQNFKNTEVFIFT